MWLVEWNYSMLDFFEKYQHGDSYFEFEDQLLKQYPSEFGELKSEYMQAK